MKTRIVKNWRTTAIGLIALGAGVVGLMLGKVTGGEFVGIMGLAGTYLVAKDTLIEGITGGAVKVDKT